MSEPSTVVIPDRVVVPCPACGVNIPVPIVVTVEGLLGEQRITADPDLADLWAHAWGHTDREEGTG